MEAEVKLHREQQAQFESLVNRPRIGKQTKDFPFTAVATAVKGIVVGAFLSLYVRHCTIIVRVFMCQPLGPRLISLGVNTDLECYDAVLMRSFCVPRACKLLLYSSRFDEYI